MPETFAAFPAAWATKTVSHRFAGADLTYKLSHALFSSFDIDKGSLLLLKTLAQQVELSRLTAVLDVGCGVGVLGLDLKKKQPTLRLVAQDRDVLACAFTAENARLNGLTDGLEVRPGLALTGLTEKFDLIVSNLPAKAGEPVLTDFFARAGHFLTAGGRCAVVIVHTLADWARQTLARLQLELLFEEDGLDYTVFHFRGQAEPATDSFAPYTRDRVEAVQGKTHYSLTTRWGLPNFDSLDYPTLLALEFWEKRPVGGRVLFWEPGQGHLPVLAVSLKKPGLRQAVLVGRDTLALQGSAANLASLPVEVTTLPVSHLGALAQPDLTATVGILDAAVIRLQSEPDIPWAEAALAGILAILPEGAPVLVTGSSTEVHRFLEIKHHLISTGRDSKYRGFRSLWLKRG